ncbi:DUF5689 domain-containing protein [Flavobacterium branchiophilum]|uniref:DUF5689 domain-containing protein n=1 Tax=Flavobacterium branchiophilum TaxID=55197 RepID=A0A2H3KD85_9FLAO|nr:DUF5689 domain-containing protein [Flavobacterium branchiophilum]PDS24469.1 hypothetical protein B0A77_08020 [Flavobacterium branchiophilum]
MKKFAILSTSLLLTLLSSCVNDTFETPTPSCVSPNLAKTKEVSNIYAIAPNPTGTPANSPIYTADDIIEGYVISSDEGGNFYKSMYVQPTDGSKGFNISIDEGNVYTKDMQPGKKIFVKMKGLAYANPTNYARGLIIGAPPTEQYAVDRLSSLTYKNNIIPSCDIISEDAIVKHITLAQAKANDTYLNTLVEFDNVQFESENITYDPVRTDDFDSSINITDGATTLTIRTSRYANFAGNIVPSGRGKIRGVLTKYGTGSNPFQLVLRTERDVKLTGPRADFSPALVGNNIQYLGTISENFESYPTTTAGYNFPKYINDAFVGSRYWDVKSFSNNKYIQMTSFGAGPNKAYFIVPVDFTAANSISFKTKDGYNVGAVLKVYYATNYTPGGNIAQATLTDITSNFTIASGTATGYAVNFTNSGTYAFPTALIGNGFVMFEYSGTTSITTTMQIDDILIN